MIHAFTSSAPNYSGKVRALFQSLRRHHPEIRRHWLVADVRSPETEALVDGEADETWFVDDFEACRAPSWHFQLDVVELSTAIKPECARMLMARPDCELLLYFDPDMVLFSPLDDLVDLLRSASLVLTPHLLRPEVELDAVLDHELCALRHGVFNLGFVGIRDCDEGRAFLDWWRERCRISCSDDWRDGVFTDQKWVNFAPVFFPGTAIARSPRFNVAPWNVNQRPLSGTFEDGFEVLGEPLGFYHFTGFDSGAHRQVIAKYAAGNPAVTGLVDWYEHRTRFLGPPAGTRRLLERFDNGEEIQPVQRRVYRQRDDLQAAFPDPYRVAIDANCFRRWFQEQAPREYPDLADRTTARHSRP